MITNNEKWSIQSVGDGSHACSSHDSMACANAFWQVLAQLALVLLEETQPDRTVFLDC